MSLVLGSLAQSSPLRQWSVVSCFVFILRRRVKIEYLRQFSRINHIDSQEIPVWRIQIAVNDKATIFNKIRKDVPYQVAVKSAPLFLPTATQRFVPSIGHIEFLPFCLSILLLMGKTSTKLEVMIIKVRKRQFCL